MKCRSVMTLSVLAMSIAAGFATQVALAEEATPSSSETVTKEVEEAIAAVKQYSAEKREEALAKARQALNDLDVVIAKREAELREKWDEMSEEARKKAAEAETELDDRRAALEEWYGGLKHGSASAWSELKDGFANAYAAFQKAWETSDTTDTEKTEP